MIDEVAAEQVLPGRAVVYPRPLRLLAAALVALAGTSILLLAIGLLASDRPTNPLHLIRDTVLFVLAPGGAVGILRHLYAARLRLQPTMLVVEQRHRRIEIPRASIATVEPRLLPIPASAIALRLRSGRRSDDLELEHPRPLLDALPPSDDAPVSTHPTVVYADARGAWPHWRRRVLAFAGFALVPTVPLFRVHQLIAYGGTFGEYYQYGLGAYLAGFAIYWATLTIYLLAYAAVLRIPVEIVTIGLALGAPSYARPVRRRLQQATTILYYAGVPLVVALRFVPW